MNPGKPRPVIIAKKWQKVNVTRRKDVRVEKTPR
jgi:hypothetical protein